MGSRVMMVICVMVLILVKDISLNLRLINVFIRAPYVGKYEFRIVVVRQRSFRGWFLHARQTTH